MFIISSYICVREKDRGRVSDRYWRSNVCSEIYLREGPRSSTDAHFQGDTQPAPAARAVWLRVASDLICEAKVWCLTRSRCCRENIVFSLLFHLIDSFEILSSSLLLQGSLCRGCFSAIYNFFSVLWRDLPQIKAVQDNVRSDHLKLDDVSPFHTNVVHVSGFFFIFSSS